MKIFNIAALGLLATLAFSGCEMKDELYGGKNKDADQGTLELEVAAKEPYSQSRAAVSTAEFPVTIEGTELDSPLAYAKASEVPAAITLPVGTYKVSAHTPGELKKKLDTPYYAGENTLTIAKGQNTATTVTCKMKNTRVQVNYGDNFLSGFKSWTITVTAGTDNALTYETAASSPAPIYIAIEDEKVEAITVNITAVTNSDVTVSQAKTFKKSDASEKYDDVNSWFEGGDAIVINMGAVAASSGTVTGITINAKVSFEDKKDEILIDPSENETPDTPDADGPTLTFQKNVEKVTYISDNEITYSMSDSPTSFDATIKAPKKIESIVVKIIAGNEGFAEILKDLKMDGQQFIDSGVDVVENSEFNSLLSSQQLTGVKKGDTEYVFPIGVFFKFLNVTGKTDADKAHQFDIVVTDQVGNSISGTLKIHITE